MTATRGKNLQGFTADLNKFSKKMHLSIGVVVQKVSMDVLRGVVMRTPVKSGRCRGSWLIGVNEPPKGGGLPEGVVLNAQSATATSMKQAIKLGKVTALSAVYIINPLPYALPLEHGSSQDQAPHGMVKVTLEAVSASINRGRL